MNEKLCGRTPGIPLSAEGKIQALALAQALRQRPLTAIYTSPLERACETANQVAATHGLAPITDERLIELDFGRWTGMRFEDLASEESWAQYNQTRSSTPPPGGESPLAARSRACQAVYSAASAHRSAHIAMVTHADIIRSVLTELLDMSLDHLLRFEISPASVTEVSVDDRQATVHSVNRTFEQLF